jgi:hypothetical protein
MKYSCLTLIKRADVIESGISGARQFDSVTVFVVTAKYKFARSSLCLRYTDFKRFDTLVAARTCILTFAADRISRFFMQITAK